jgi:hypothetical protein
MRPIHALAVGSFLVLLCGCPKEDDSLTSEEAADAMNESTVSSQASALTSSSVQISTTFTLGKGVQHAADEIRTFIQSQLACADVTLADATLTVRYGAKPGNCTYKGHTFSGSQSITVSKNEDNQVIVDHKWTELSNGVVKVTGTAHVTWDFEDEFRHITHDLTWTRIADGRTGHGTGDRTQRALDNDINEGITDDGSLAWEGKAGKWDLTIDDVEWRWIDPVPQSGSYHLATPKGKSLSFAFGRVGEDTIHVTVSNGSKSFGFDVNHLGAAVAKD